MLYGVLFLQDTCEVDAQNELKQLTPLDLAAQRGYSRIVECLIGYGANPAHTSWDGMNSVQHLTAMKNAKPPNVYTPYLKKVHIVRQSILYLASSPFSLRKSCSF